MPIVSYTDLGLGDVEVTGPEGTFFVYVTLDEINGALYGIFDSDGTPMRVFADRDQAIEHAAQLAGEPE